MNKIKLAVYIGAALCLVLSVSATYAQASRVWVGGALGDDANPCSRTAPCKTFAGAQAKVAVGGEIDALDPGDFKPVTITKGLTIDGGNFAAVFVYGSNGISVSVGVSDVVTLRNMTLLSDGSALNGIRFGQGKALHVEHVTISGFSNIGIDFEPSAASKLFVNDSNIAECAGGGIYVAPSVAVDVNANIDQVQVYRSFFGIAALGATHVTVRDSALSGNTTSGFSVHSTGMPAVLNLDSNMVTSNGQSPLDAGVRSEGADAIARITNNTILNNSVGLLSVSGGGIVSFANNRVGGNDSDGSPTFTIYPYAVDLPLLER